MIESEDVAKSNADRLQPPGGYAIGKNGLYWRAIDAPEPNPDYPEWITPDYKSEVYWPPEKGQPPNPEPPKPTAAEILAAARAERDRLLTYATLRINPLQYASDVGEASEEDLALLKLWKKYSVAVSKTETNPGWPESPQWPSPPVPLE